MMNTVGKVTRMLAVALLAGAATLLAGNDSAAQANPPQVVNYQGVLRDGTGQPLDGSYDMVFRFFSAETGGDEFLVDSHTLASGGRVTVTGGIFNALLFNGVVTDGSGPGIVLSAIDTFYNSEVWLQVEVGHDIIALEPLTPRVRIFSAPYAMNAATLGGSLPSRFLDVTDVDQTKFGRLTLSKQAPGISTLEVTGADYAARFTNAVPNGGEVRLSSGEAGMLAFGRVFAGYFGSTFNSNNATLGGLDAGVKGIGTVGVEGTGTLNGGLFKDYYGQSSARLGLGNVAVQAVGVIGVDAVASDIGGRFINALGTGQAYLALGAVGVEGTGSAAGGSFYSTGAASQALLGYGNFGVYAVGGPGILAYPTTYATLGILGSGNAGVWGASFGGEYDSAGYFEDFNHNTTVNLGLAGTGITTRGSVTGGYFDTYVDPYAKAWLAGDSTPPGCATCYSPTWGIWSEGAYAPGHANGGGGFFKDVYFSGYAKVGHENYGIQGFGGTMGGYFKDTDSSGEAHLASADRGIYAFGSFVGGAFSHPNLTSFWANVATATHKISGTGAVSFVQNHPHDPDKVIVYSSPEGDEVATYTRGTARLHNGEARVALGSTFSMVTNPDIGLTAHLTSHGDAVPLGVVSISTEELVVTGPRGSNAVFDFLVYGLRIGFEESAVVQTKEREAGLPEASAVEDQLKGDNSLRAYRAFDRFTEMERSAGRASAALSAHGGADSTPGAAALRTAIAAAGVNEVGRRKDYEPEMTSAAGDPKQENARREEELARRNADTDRQRPVLPGVTGQAPGVTSPRPVSSFAPSSGSEVKPVDGATFKGRLVVTLPADGSVQSSDLVASEGASDGAVRAASKAADRAVVGIALERRQDGSVDVVVGGMAMLRVDATWGPIATGDLLTASSNPGHAMRSPDAAPGTVVAKALEPLEAGTGIIRVLVMNR